MIRSITRQKPEEEIDHLLDGLVRVFIIGCGTCVTLTRTGGEPEVREVREGLSKKGKLITGDVIFDGASTGFGSFLLDGSLKGTITGLAQNETIDQIVVGYINGVQGQSGDGPL